MASKIPNFGPISLISLCLLMPATWVNAQSTPERMVAAAEAFLESLEEDQRGIATWRMDSEERQNWNFVPIPGKRKGLPIKAMTNEQRTAAHAMLMTGLSNQGYLKANGIIQLEGILAVIENNPSYRDTELYYVTLFGTPSVEEPWGWRFEGHHLSLNYSSVDQTLVAAPLFWGANPARVLSGPHAGLRVLGEEEDLARALVHALTDEQQAVARIAPIAPRDILTGNDRKVMFDSFQGLPAAEMTDAQRAMLWRVIQVYAANLPTDVAHVQVSKIHEAGFNQLYFAWAGGIEKGDKHYYRIHGPTFLIEYDNTQGDGNHVHSVWRDLTDDFGEDLLGRHYEMHEH